jgi:hypothetical protein
MMLSSFRWLRPATVAVVLCLLYIGFIYIYYGRNPLEFVRPTPSGSQGYDGQFAYCIALDPVYPAPCLDVPAYRYQRILHPLLARYVGLLNEVGIIWALLAINIAGLFVGTLALESLLVDLKVSRWYALIYGLFGGIFFAVRVNTAEPLVYGLVLAAIWLAGKQRWTLHALLLSLAAFSKETTLIFTAAYVALFVLERRWRDAVRLVIIAVIPFAVWQVVLRAWFGTFGVGSGGAMATPFEIIPFMGVWRIGLEGGARVFAVVGFPALLFGVLPALWGLWRAGREVLAWLSNREGGAVVTRRYEYALLLLAQAAIMLFVPFSTYRESLGLARFMPGLVAMVLLYAALRRERRALTYSSLWLVWGLQMLG